MAASLTLNAGVRFGDSANPFAQDGNGRKQGKNQHQRSPVSR